LENFRAGVRFCMLIKREINNRFRVKPWRVAPSWGEGEVTTLLFHSTTFNTATVNLALTRNLSSHVDLHTRARLVEQEAHFITCLRP